MRRRYIRKYLIKWVYSRNSWITLKFNQKFTKPTNIEWLQRWILSSKSKMWASLKAADFKGGMILSLIVSSSQVQLINTAFFLWSLNNTPDNEERSPKVIGVIFNRDNRFFILKQINVETSNKSKRRREDKFKYKIFHLLGSFKIRKRKM